MAEPQAYTTCFIIILKSLPQNSSIYRPLPSSHMSINHIHLIIYLRSLLISCVVTLLCLWHSILSSYKTWVYLKSLSGYHLWVCSSSWPWLQITMLEDQMVGGIQTQTFNHGHHPKNSQWETISVSHYY